MRINMKYFQSGTPDEKRLMEKTRLAATGGDDQNGGIENPKQQHLRQGYYFRFADSKKPPVAQRGGSWWLELETLQKIRNFSRSSVADGSIPDARREAVRYFLALPWDFSRCDLLIRAKFNQEVEVYRGVGRTARGHAPATASTDSFPTRYIPPQHVKELYQIFVPGMADLHLKILTEVRSDDIWKSPYFT